MENLILTGQTEGQIDSEKQCITYLVSLSKWMAEEILGEITERRDLLRATKDRKLWGAIYCLCPELTMHIKKKICNVNFNENADFKISIRLSQMFYTDIL